MNKIFFTLILIMLSQGIYSQDKQDTGKEKISKQTLIVFKTTSYDFGKIKYEGNGTAAFIFKNISKNPVKISNIKPSCGCTGTDWTKEEVKKGKKGKIIVKYDTKNIGTFHKTIAVFLENQQETIQLEIKGEVLKPVINKVNGTSN